MRIIITGGHHSSALPVIKQLREQHPEVEIFWFGHKFSAQGDKNPTLEFREITALGLPFYHINAGKFYRTLNLKRLLKIPYGFFQCLYLLVKIKPGGILSFGGYVAVPVVLAGRLLGIPSITHEQTVVAGWANRLVSKVARKVLISWKESEKYFPKDKTVFVGLPLRKEIYETGSNNFDPGNSLPTIYITTGKIGSHIINTTVAQSLPQVLDFSNVIHQCGDNSVYSDYAMLQDLAVNMKEKAGKYFLRKFILGDEVGEAYGRADLVISRSGAHTTGELLALRKKCLLIPIPWVSHNEQNENAKILVSAGLGTVLPENELTSQRFIEEIKHVLDTKSSEKIVAVMQNRNGDPAELIINQLMELIK